MSRIIAKQLIKKIIVTVSVKAVYWHKTSFYISFEKVSNKIYNIYEI